MARRIRTKEDAIGASPEEIAESTGEGVTFINNFINRKFWITPTHSLQFKRCRQAFTDPVEIQFLKGLAAQKGSFIFIFPTEPAEPAEPAEPEPVAPAAI
jgi:hypothetical protein